MVPANVEPTDCPASRTNGLGSTETNLEKTEYNRNRVRAMEDKKQSIPSKKILLWQLLLLPSLKDLSFLA